MSPIKPANPTTGPGKAPNALATSVISTDPPDATSEPPPLVDDPRRSRSCARLDLDRELADRILSGLRRRGYATPIASPDADDRTGDIGLHQWVGAVRCPHLSG